MTDKKKTQPEVEVLPDAESKALVPVEATKKGRKTVEIDEPLIDKAVQFIKAKSAEHFYKGSIEIGEYIIKHFFDDNFELASSKDPRKAASYRKLCDREDLPISASTLNRMVNVAKQEKFLVSNKINVEALNYTHRLELLGLDYQSKLDMATRIIQESLSARETRKVITEEKKKMPQDSPGKEKHPRVDSSIKDMRMFLKETPFSKYDFKDVANLDETKRKLLKETAVSVTQRLKNITKNYKKLIDDIEAIEKGLSTEGG